MQMKEATKPRGAAQGTLEDLRTKGHEDSALGWKRIDPKIVGHIWLLCRYCGISLGLLRPCSILAQDFMVILDVEKYPLEPLVHII